MPSLQPPTLDGVATTTRIRLIALLGAAATIGLFITFPGLIPAALRQKPEFSDTQIIRALHRTEEVSVLSLGITGITSQEKNSHLFSMELPGTDRARYIQYTFDAKLGFDGQDVVIESTGEENQFDLTIPPFKFIGYDHPEYQVILDNNGLLSWGTPQIETADMINEILTDKAKKEYIATNEDVIRDQTRSFYTSIITSVAPDAKLNFFYTDADGKVVPDENNQ